MPIAAPAKVDGKPVAVEPARAIRAWFGFCPEDRKTDGIIGDLSIRENIALALQARRGWARPLSRGEQNALADLHQGAGYPHHRPGKADPAAVRRQPAEGHPGPLAGDQSGFLILDEPTRGIDVGAHAEIIRLIEELCEKGMSLIVISSELEELMAYSSRISYCGTASMWRN
jgi:monosaccharide-transporting ATPase